MEHPRSEGQPESEFKISEATRQMTKQEMSMQLEIDESAVIYSGLREVFYHEAGTAAVKTRVRRQTAAKRSQTRRK